MPCKIPLPEVLTPLFTVTFTSAPSVACQAFTAAPTIAPTSVIPVLSNSTNAATDASNSAPAGPSMLLLAPTIAEPLKRPVSTLSDKLIFTPPKSNSPSRLLQLDVILYTPRFMVLTYWQATSSKFCNAPGFLVFGTELHQLLLSLNCTP